MHTQQYAERNNQLKPLTRVFNQAIQSQSSLSKAAGCVLFIGMMGLTQSASAVDISNLDGANGFSLNGILSGGATRARSRTVHKIGDINGDGVADFAAESGGIFHSDRTHLVFGNATAEFPEDIDVSELNGTNGFTVEGNLLSASDINSDGIADLVLGSPNRDTQLQNFVLFGRDTHNDGAFSANLSSADMNGANGFRIIDPANNGSLAIVAPGDISGDGIDDVVVMEYDSDSSSNTVGDTTYSTKTHSLYVIFGQQNSYDFPADILLSQMDGDDGYRVQNAIVDNTRFTTFSGYGSQAYDYSENTSIEDTNVDFTGDGINDLIIRTRTDVPDHYYNHNARIKAIIISELADNGVYPAVADNLNDVTTAEVSSMTFTRTVDVAGDINGDGVEDILVAGTDYYGRHYTDLSFGADENNAIDPGEQRVRINFGYGGFFNFDHRSGTAQALGDVNGDGLDDLLLNVTSENNPNQITDAIRYVLFGRNTLLQGNFPDTLVGLDFDGELGFALVGQNSSVHTSSAMGDVNGDGIKDIIISRPGFTHIRSVDRVQVIYGRDAAFPQSINLDTMNASTGFSVYDDRRNELGRSLSVDDINGDGVVDLILGTNGSVHVVLNNPDDTPEPVIACPGDINGNGVQDFAVLVQDPETGTAKVIVKDIDGNEISNIDYTNIVTPADLEVVNDLNNNSAPEFAVLDQQSGTVEVRDGLEGDEIGLVEFGAVRGAVDLELLTDQDNNGAQELALLDGSNTVQINDPLTSASLYTSRFSTSSKPIDLSIFNTLPPKAGRLEENDNPNQPDIVEIRDLSTGRIVKSLWYGIGWNALKMELLTDMNGNGSQEIAVLRETDEKVNVLIRDSVSGAIISSQGYSPDYPSVDMVVLPDLNANGSEEIAVLGHHKTSGKIKATVKDTKDKNTIRTMYFNKNLIPLDLAVCPDMNGNNKPEIAVLGERSSDGKLRLIVKDSKSGSLIGTIDY